MSQSDRLSASHLMAPSDARYHYGRMYSIRQFEGSVHKHVWKTSCISLAPASIALCRW